MRCFIVTQAHLNRFRVHKVVARYGWTPTYCCDTELQKSRLASLGIPKQHIILSDVPENAGIQGVSLARDFVCRKLMPQNEWSIWIDDNVEKITGISPAVSSDRLNFEDGKNWRELFSKTLTPIQLNIHIRDTIQRAEQARTIFCGFANQENYFWRASKWQDFGYCRTQFALYKNDGSTWMPFDTMMWEDGFKSIDVVARYGQVVINRHIRAVKPMFETGGIGSFKRRLPWLRDNCKRLIEMFPGLVKYQGNGSQYGMSDADKFHLMFAKRTTSTVSKWRKEHGYA